MGQQSDLAKLPTKERRKRRDMLCVLPLILAVLFLLAAPLLLSIEASDFTFFFLCSTFFALIALAMAQRRSIKLLAFSVGIIACAGAILETYRSQAGMSILENAAMNSSIRGQNKSTEQMRAELRWAISASNAAQAGRPLPPAPTTLP